MVEGVSENVDRYISTPTLTGNKLMESKGVFQRGWTHALSHVRRDLVTTSSIPLMPDLTLGISHLCTASYEHSMDILTRTRHNPKCFFHQMEISYAVSGYFMPEHSLLRTLDRHVDVTSAFPEIAEIRQIFSSSEISRECLAI
jgi:hypothetical protein